MALNQKTTSQQKRPKTTNCFLACFGIHPKTTNNNTTTTTTSNKKKPTKFGVRKKFFSKLCWPKFKTINVDNFNKKKKKNFKFDASKTAVLRASHNIMLEATKVHHQQFKMIDHHHASKSISTKEPILLPYKESTHLEDYQSRPSHGATCYTKDNDHTPKAAVLKQQQPLFVDKVTKDYSLIGASIMVAMLIILSIWGRLCAILCMCGWLYCIPFLRGDNKEVIITSSNNNDMNTKMSIHFNPNLNTKMNIDFNSELYKKKVVLDGLLQRNHQNVVGIT